MEKIKLLEVQSQRLYFRRLRATDLELASCVLQNAETMAAWDRPYDRSDTLDFIADMLRRYRTDGIGYVAAFEKQTDELVALCGLLAEQLDVRPSVSAASCAAKSAFMVSAENACPPCSAARSRGSSSTALFPSSGSTTSVRSRPLPRSA